MTQSRRPARLATSSADATSWTLRLATVPPIASAPTGRRMRLASTGERCTLVRRTAEGVEVRLTDDGYLVTVLSSELV